MERKKKMVADEGEDGGGEEPYPGIDREQGDGEEDPEGEEEVVDDDEDKRNPQYIPKRGMFYEHDDRIDPADEEDEEGGEDKEKLEAEAKKKIWKADTASKWGHDKFMELEQLPKGEEELVAAYGYDIRDEDNAPRARRRRRYGRGPNKYTRNWEDEEAYVKPTAPRGRGGATRGGREEFPALGERDGGDEEEEKRVKLKREATNPEMKRETRPEYKREKSTPEFKTREDRGGRGGRRSWERDEESWAPRGRGRGKWEGGGRGGRGRGRGEDGHWRGGRGGGPDDGHWRGGRGGGGFEGRGRGGGRGNWEDRGRGGDRGERRQRDEVNRNYAGGAGDHPEFRGGRGGRGRGRGRGGGGGGEDRREGRGGSQGKEEVTEGMAGLDLVREGSSETGGRGGPKRYSSQRRGGPTTPLQEQMFAEGMDPSLCSGPPAHPPFQSPLGQNARLNISTAVSQSGLGSVPAAFIAPSPIHFSPQFPGVPVTQVMVPNPQAGLPHIAADPMILAGQGGPDSFTEVRGGVTYFNPTAQNFMPQRPSVNKRPKAAIAIIDPSSGGRESMEGELAPELLAEQ